jgi:hypothetical protein
VTVPSRAQQDALAMLAPLLPADAYLAGGVAIAMRLGHRVSHDLDDFTVSTDPQALVEALSGRSEVRVTTKSEGTLYLEIGGVPVSIIRHRYPLLARAEQVDGVPIASLEDLTAMKLQAIATRGAARDFWDLHALLERRSISLADALDDFVRRYSIDEVGQVLRILAYFGDAESAPLPAGLDRERWEAIRQDFERWARAM